MGLIPAHALPVESIKLNCNTMTSQKLFFLFFSTILTTGMMASSSSSGVLYQLRTENTTFCNASTVQCALDASSLTIHLTSRGACAVRCTEHVASGDYCNHFNVIQTSDLKGVKVMTFELFLFTPTQFGVIAGCSHFQSITTTLSQMPSLTPFSSTTTATFEETTPTKVVLAMGNTSICPAKYIYGVAICSDLIYVICWHSRNLHILNITTLSPITTLTLPAALTYSWDITFGVDQTLTKRLYIIDYNAIVWQIKVNASGFSLPGSVWNSTQTPAKLNVTNPFATLSFTNGRILVPFSKPGNMLMIYDSLMNPLFNISSPSDATDPIHAKQTANDTFVSLDKKNPAVATYDTLSWLCKNTTTVCDEYVGPAVTEYQHVAIDENGFVYVADYGLSRLLMFTPALSVQIIQLTYTLVNEKPFRLNYDPTSGLLAIGLYAKSGYSDLRIYQIQQ